MPIITNEDNFGIPLILIWLFMLFFSGKRGKIAAILILIAFAITDLIAAQYIKPLVGRLRPSHALTDSINLLVGKGGQYSFVSNHAANTMAIATIIGYFYVKWRSLVIAISLIIGFSRIYVGVHYPFDVLGGWIFGYIVAWIVLSIWVLLKIRELKKGHTWVNYT